MQIYVIDYIDFIALNKCNTRQKVHFGIMMQLADFFPLL